MAASLSRLKCATASRLAVALLLAVGLATPGHAQDPLADIPPVDPETLELGAPAAWSRSDGQLISAKDVRDRIAEVPYVLLGELHDNAHHHAAQQWLFGGVAGSHPRRLVFEMINADQAPALAEFAGAGETDAAALGPAIAWSKQGWPSWAHYAPIAAHALKADVPIVAGDVARAQIRTVGRGGLDKLNAEDISRLALDRPLAPKLAAALTEELWVGHCEMLPREALGGISAAQRLRDAALAEAMLTGATLGVDQPSQTGEDAGNFISGAVLIAGNGHVRGDRGVPWYLRARGVSDDQIAVVVLTETDVGTAVDPVALAATAEDLEADFVWSLPRATREDPCEVMRRHMQRRATKPAGDGSAASGAPE